MVESLQVEGRLEETFGAGKGKTVLAWEIVPPTRFGTGTSKCSIPLSLLGFFRIRVDQVHLGPVRSNPCTFLVEAAQPISVGPLCRVADELVLFGNCALRPGSFCFFQGLQLCACPGQLCGEGLKAAAAE